MLSIDLDFCTARITSIVNVEVIDLESNDQRRQSDHITG